MTTNTKELNINELEMINGGDSDITRYPHPLPDFGPFINPDPNPDPFRPVFC